MESLNKYIYDPSDRSAFELAHDYELYGQLAAAIGFYLETADLTTNELLQYESLVRAALCFQEQGDRTSAVTDLLLRAVALRPECREAHFILARNYEWAKDWHPSYMHACIGLNLSKNACVKPIKGYVPKCFEFQKGVAAWWIGRTEESRDLMYYVYNESIELRDIAFRNLRNIGYPRSAFQYRKEQGYRIQDKFPGYQHIEKNYAQSAQDLFALTALCGQKGYYLEIGSADPIMFNNTYLLELQGWQGTSLEIEYHHVAKHNLLRKNPAVCADALTYNYADTYVDYLQVDCEPPATTLAILKKVLADGCRPKIITFEHDRYIAGDEVAIESRDILTKLGYVLKVKDVCFDNHNSPFEDWWVAPELEMYVPRNAENILGIDYILKK